MEHKYLSTAAPILEYSSGDASDEGLMAYSEVVLPASPGDGNYDSTDRQKLIRKKRHKRIKNAALVSEEPLSSIGSGSTDHVDNSDGISSTRKYFSVFVLFLINLLNYMDRYTIAGILLSIKQNFGISNASAGLLQTVFIVSYMIVAPLFGYLGDRYNRKLVMFAGMLVWSGCTLLASFVTDPSDFWYFLALRGLVGIGEASYSTIAPTIIADLFVKTKRTRMLSVFYFATPVGSGLGYIVGSAAAKGLGAWYWALRITPGLGLITMILMMLILPNPKRGGAETSPDVAESRHLDKSYSTYLDDLYYVVRNRSFLAVTVGFTFMAFVVGSLALWGPVYVAYAQIAAGALLPCTNDDCQYTNVSFVFGLITCLAGFLGVLVGAESAKKWKDRGNVNADAHVCAIGLISAAPLLFIAFLLATTNLPLAWTFMFLAEMGLCLTWTLVSDMTLYVTMPSRRSTAQAVQILVVHLFGDAGSPYLLGVMSDSFTASLPDNYHSKYIALQWSIYLTLFASVLGGVGFLVASLYLQNDKKRVVDALANNSRRASASSSNESIARSDSSSTLATTSGSAKAEDSPDGSHLRFTTGSINNDLDVGDFPWPSNRQRRPEPKTASHSSISVERGDIGGENGDKPPGLAQAVR